mmetsp:Transcript_41239/g.103110  ORF Transcript_41239/g.103110 Transcript_41239/m.103110 type:complete len:88 (-) Transcript_41239:829-1092(-)
MPDMGGEGKDSFGRHAVSASDLSAIASAAVWFAPVCSVCLNSCCAGSDGAEALSWEQEILGDRDSCKFLKCSRDLFRSMKRLRSKWI